MAPIGEQKKSGTTASATGNVATTPAGGERKSFFSRLIPSPAAQGGTGSQTARPARQQSPMGKMLFGWMIMLVVVEVVSIALQYVDIKFFNLALEKPWFHTNAFLIGGMNTYFLLNLVAIVGAYYLLVRFKLMPRDLFGARPQAATTVNQPGKPAPDGLGKSRHSRASRRYTGAHVATTTQTSSTRRVPARTGTAATPPPPTAPTSSDDHYYLVKEAQRQQRRREAKR
jgi:hypothetical protein